MSPLSTNLSRESLADISRISSFSASSLLSKMRSSKSAKVLLRTLLTALLTYVGLPRVGITTDTVGPMRILRCQGLWTHMNGVSELANSGYGIDFQIVSTWPLVLRKRLPSVKQRS